MNTHHYFYRDGANREIGPLPLSAIAQLRQAGVLSDDTLLRLESDTNWLPCREVIAIGTTPIPPAPGNNPSSAINGVVVKKHAWSFTAGAMLCFLLPFVEFSCQSKSLLARTGLQLVTGGEIDVPREMVPPNTEVPRMPPQPNAGVALGAALVATLLGLARRRQTNLAAGIVAAVGVWQLVTMRSAIEGEIHAQAMQALLQINFEAKEGYLGAVALLTLGAISHFWLYGQPGLFAGEREGLSLTRGQKRGIGAVVVLVALFYLGPVAFQVMRPRAGASNINQQKESAGNIDPQPVRSSLTSKATSAMSRLGSGQSWENSLGMKFVAVPATTVLFSVWDTRVQDYQEFAQATKREWSKPHFEQGPTHPAVNVSWDDAQAFCAWLTAAEQGAGLLGENQKYRLPTDEEWNMAVGLDEARGATKNGRQAVQFAWGTQWPPPYGAGNYSHRLAVDDFGEASPVGSFAANKHGLYDMGGNVYQWCEDFYDDVFDDRVLRGSYFNSANAAELSLFNRDKGEPSLRSDGIGFRCVLVTDGTSESRRASSEPNSQNRANMERVIMSNLRQLSHACNQYFLETGKAEATFAQLEQLAGSKEHLMRIRPAMGEDYAEIRIKQGEMLRLRLPDGHELSYNDLTHAN